MTTNKILKSVLLVSAIAALIYFVLMFVSPMTMFSALDSFHTKRELIENYDQRRIQILQLKGYYNSIVPKDKQIEIEFKNDNTLVRFGISPIDTKTGTIIYPIFLKWNLKTNSSEVDSVIKTIGWTHQTLKDLKEKLDHAHCIQIESGEPTKIGWQRSGLGMYFYDVFRAPIDDSLKRHYDDGCIYILYNDHLVLEYGGGAAGPQCFPKN